MDGYLGLGGIPILNGMIRKFWLQLSNIEEGPIVFLALALNVKFLGLRI